MSRIRVAVVGATGYAGSELVRLLTRHSEVELVLLTSESSHGRNYSDFYPSFRGFVDAKLRKMDALHQLQVDVAF